MSFPRTGNVVSGNWRGCPKDVRLRTEDIRNFIRGEFVKNCRIMSFPRTGNVVSGNWWECPKDVRLRTEMSNSDNMNLKQNFPNQAA